MTLKDDLELVLTRWEQAYPTSVFPELKPGEMTHAMTLLNAEDPNQSARLYAEWARHIIKHIRLETEGAGV